ncbi:unnamed protein product [Mortierella alpina]
MRSKLGTPLDPLPILPSSHPPSFFIVSLTAPSHREQHRTQTYYALRNEQAFDPIVTLLLRHAVCPSSMCKTRPQEDTHNCASQSRPQEDTIMQVNLAHRKAQLCQ